MSSRNGEFELEGELEGEFEFEGEGEFELEGEGEFEFEGEGESEFEGERAGALKLKANTKASLKVKSSSAGFVASGVVSAASSGGQLRPRSVAVSPRRWSAQPLAAHSAE